MMIKDGTASTRNSTRNSTNLSTTSLPKKRSTFFMKMLPRDQPPIVTKESRDNVYPYYNVPSKMKYKESENEDGGHESSILNKKRSKHHYKPPPGMLANLVDWGHRHRSTWNSLSSNTTIVSALIGLEELRYLDMVLIQEWTNVPSVITDESPSSRYWVYDQDCELRYKGRFEHLRSCTGMLCCLGCSSNKGFSVSMMDNNSRLSMSMTCLRRGQDKVAIMGRLSIIGYIVVKASGRMSSTVELIIQDSQGVDRVRIMGLKSGWGKTVKLYRIPQGSLKPSDASDKSVFRKLTQQFSDENRIGSMIKVHTSPVECPTSELNGWDYDLLIDTETIVVNFPKIFNAEIKACIIAAAFAMDHLKRRRRSSLNQL